jgi:hypothetical protein
MKWNFECESERRDYLHDPVVLRSNGFAPSMSSIELNPMQRRWLRANSRLSADNVRHDDESKMIVAGSLAYSVSHFIDCHSFARTL